MMANGNSYDQPTVAPGKPKLARFWRWMVPWTGTMTAMIVMAGLLIFYRT